MSNLLIIILIGVAIAATAGYSAITLWQSADDSYAQQMIWARLEQTAAALKSNIKIIDGLPALPKGAAITGTYSAYNQVPVWVTANAYGPNGIPFVYCPYAPRGNWVEGTSDTVTGPGYSIITYNSTITGGKDYVVGSTAPAFAGTTAMAPKGLLGYLISFKPRDTYDATSAAAWCNSITVSAAGQLSTTGTTVSGIVYPIITPQSLYQQVAAKSDLVTLYVAVTASGDSSGRNLSNPMTLDAAFAQLAGLKPYRAKLYLGMGVHTLSNIFKTTSTMPAADVTPGATTGSGVTFTASAAVFSANDVGKTISGNYGTAAITAFTDSTHVVADIGTDFASTSAITSTNWSLIADNYNKGNLQQQQIDIEGAGSGATTITLGSNFDLPVNVIFRSLTITPGSYAIIMPGVSQYMFRDVALAKLEVRNGSAWIGGTSSVDTSVVVTDGGRLVIGGTGTTNVTSSVPNQGFQIRPGRVDILSGASLTVTATNTTGTPKAPVIVYGGGSLGISGAMTVTSNGSTTLQQGINVVPGGHIYMNKGDATVAADGTLTFNTGTGSIAGDGTGGSCPGAGCACPGAICLGGDMYMNNSKLLFPNGTAASTAAVALADGGQFYMHNASAIGSNATPAERPFWGVYDNGGSLLGGSSTGYSTGANGEGGSPQSNIYALSTGLCWAGNPLPVANTCDHQRHLFIDSPAGNNGNVSTPGDHNSTITGCATTSDYRHLVIQNQTNWLCTR